MIWIITDDWLIFEYFITNLESTILFYSLLGVNNSLIVVIRAPHSDYDILTLTIITTN